MERDRCIADLTDVDLGGADLTGVTELGKTGKTTVLEARSRFGVNDLRSVETSSTSV